MDQQSAQIDVAAFADPEQPWLASRRNLAWHQAEPGGQIAAARERGSIANRSRQRRRVQDADARDGRQPPGRGIGLGYCRELIIKRGDAPVELGPLRTHVLDQRTNPRAEGERGWQLAALVEQHCQGLLQLAPSLWGGEAALEQHGPKLVDQRGALADEPVTDP